MCRQNLIRNWVVINNFFYKVKNRFILLISFFFSFFFASAQWNTDRITLIGRNALANEDYVLAIQYFNQVIKVKPYLAEPYMFRSMAKISLGDYLGAEQDCGAAIERSPFIPQAFYTRGFARKKMGHFDSAVEDFNKALEFSPDNEVIIINRADAKEQNKEYDDAIKDLELFRKINPKEKSISYEIGRIKMAQKDTIEAMNFFTQFIENDSLNPVGYSIRALLKMQLKDEEGALSDYNNAISRKSKFEGDYINRGILNVKRNQFNQALKDYNEAIRLDSKNTLAYYNRGLLRASLGDNNNAIFDLEKVLQADSLNYEARLQKAYLEIKVGDLIAAKKDFQLIMEKYPFFVPGYYALSEINDKMGYKKEAKQLRTLAFDMENNKDFYKKKQDLIAKNQIMADVQMNKSHTNENLIEKFATEITTASNKYGENSIRGNIQDNASNLDIEKNFLMTYYQKNNELRSTNTYHPMISKFNNRMILSLPLKITNNDVELTPEVLNKHFESINNLSINISSDPNNSDYYFARAIDYMLVQDYTTAIDDLNKTIMSRSEFALAYFIRANVRFNLIKFKQSSIINNLTTENQPIKSGVKELPNNYKNDYDMILADLNRTIELTPDFSFAYYNKGNVLYILKNYNESVKAYKSAIDIDPDFAEAYYNLGITYVVLNDLKEANTNLSKAGELGIYNAYSILKTLQK